MNIMTKRGMKDNVAIYEHYCDSTEDLQNIPSDQITLGSIAIVLNDSGGSLGVYMADSSKQWHSLMMSGGEG